MEITANTVIPYEDGIQMASHCFACVSCHLEVADPQEVTAIAFDGPNEAIGI